MRKAETLDATGRAELQRQLKYARDAQSPWDAFKILHQSLGKTSYEACIRESLSAANLAPTPACYERLWRLHPIGLINLNLDRLATRAFASVYSGDKNPVEFSSRSVASHTHVLSNPYNTFIYNAHGIVDDADSWVLTSPELRKLQNRVEYQNFVKSVLSTCTVVFLGIGADDAAAGGHLDALTGTGIRTSPHYWITDRSDRLTDQWAERRGVRVIRYPNKDGSHGALLTILDDLCNYVAVDEPIPSKPVVPAKEIDEASLPSPDELTKEEPEMIRLFLNAHAQSVLAIDSDEAYERYSRFVEKYSRAIWNAWYVSLKSDENTILGYSVTQEVAKGAFGRVYKARTPEGKTVAVKILLEEIRNNRDALAAFRRGVASMRILKSRGVDGMVEYLEAAEIPAMVVMEWIEGENLRSAQARRRVSSWSNILKVGTELARILRDAHSLPERVLHRDLRPANIMLQSLGVSDDWIVKVLDFDLSWHRGAYDKTLVHDPGTTGYLAPEQIQRLQGVSTRHSAVDSFGLGMTLYFLLTGNDPLPDQHKHSDWSELVQRACASRPNPRWQSLPSRIGRLVLWATRDSQSERPDMPSLHLELRRQFDIAEGKFPDNGLDLIVEEIAFRSASFRGYHWNLDRQAAQLDTATGLNLELRANEERGRIMLSVRMSFQKSAHKKMAQALSNVREQLNLSGWKIETCRIDQSSLSLVAHLRSTISEKNLQSSVELIDKAIRILS